MPIHDRSLYLKYSEVFNHPGDFSSNVATFFAQNAEINVVHPFNQLKGADAYLSEFLLPLQHSFEGLYRRDDIFMAGEFEGQKWISSTGYYVGQFVRDWIGLKATKTLSYLRYGEFHRIEKGDETFGIGRMDAHILDREIDRHIYKVQWCRSHSANQRRIHVVEIKPLQPPVT